jgi:phage baseplate assembly protein W
MSEFERQSPSFRLAETRHGDTLQAVSYRELGDANRWPELVWLNNLSHPYITDDDRLAAPGVLLSGAMIRVPAPAGWAVNGESERGQVYERDCVLRGKLLDVDDGGDLAVVRGADNLRQQLGHRVATPRGQLIRHEEYGCLLYRLLGRVNGPTAAKLGAEYVKSCIESDYRVARVEDAVADVLGDSVKISARAIAIEGGVVDVTQGA